MIRKRTKQVGLGGAPRIQTDLRWIATQYPDNVRGDLCNIRQVRYVRRHLLKQTEGRSHKPLDDSIPRGSTERSWGVIWKNTTASTIHLPRMKSHVALAQRRQFSGMKIKYSPRRPQRTCRGSRGLETLSRTTEVITDTMATG